MTVSDAYGRILAQRSSAFLPGATLLATVPIGPRLHTLYAATGDVLGWSCVVIAACLLFLGARRAKAVVSEPRAASEASV